MDPGGSNDEGRNPNVEKDSNFEIGEAPRIISSERLRRIQKLMLGAGKRE
jgi:hypothetical protein